jgi:long-chain acyl-CoA synthetase
MRSERMTTQPVLLDELLERTLSRAPDAVAVVTGDTRLTYAELDDAVNRVANGLVARGVARGDRVTIHLEASIPLVVAVFATLKAGAAFTMVHPSTKPAKLARILADSEPRAVFVPASKLQSLAASLTTPSLRAVVSVGGLPAENDPRAVAYESLLADEAATAPARRGIDQDLAAILYTSGSTGEGKGVMLTHLNLLTAIRSITTYLGMRDDDVVFCPLSLSFSYGLSNLFATLLVGGRFVIEKSIAYRAATLGRMSKEGTTALPIVPSIAPLLLAGDLGEFDLSKLRWITNAGAALPEEHVRRIRAALPNVALYPMYGQTECVRAAFLESSLVDAKPTSVGKAIPNTEAWVVDEHGQPAAPGVTGELVIRGANVMRGYLNKPEETKKKLREGAIPGEKVLYTGDLFRMDEDGHLHFVARSDDIIKSRGEKVAPREVEEALLCMPGIEQVAVLGVPDPVFGEAVKAFIVPAAGVELTRADIVRHCAARLEDFMVPSVVEFRDALPQTDSGKIAKREL